MYFLYYAGMANDKQNEQIGLALSEDGIHFKRYKNDGLILPRDPKLPWQNLRVCNPAVIHHDGRFMMYYQGIAREGHKDTSIGLAYSQDGMTWVSEHEPVLSWSHMQSIDPQMDHSARKSLIEPFVTVENGIYKMWFVYENGIQRGSSLYYAESSDGKHWAIFGKKLLISNQFGNHNIHYPLTVRHDGHLQLWFTLRHNKSGTMGIFRLVSVDGVEWGELSQVLPAGRGRPSMGNKKDTYSRWNLDRLKGGDFSHISRLLWPGKHTRGLLGYAHPHVIEDSENQILYYHRNQLSQRGVRLDIGRCELHNGSIANQRQILAPSIDIEAWDSFFVGDPYIVRV